MPVVTFSSSEEFFEAIKTINKKLIVIDFYADWCGPCRRIAPFFSNLSEKYPDAAFLKVDTEKLKEVKQVYNVSSLPTFKFIKELQVVESISGADPERLEEVVKRLLSESGSSLGSDSCVRGQHIDQSQLECLNQSDDHKLSNIFVDDESYLESDCDEQIIISIHFTIPVKLHSMRMKAPDDGRAPMTIKLFQNQTRSLDFDDTEHLEPVQTLTLSPEQTASGDPIELRFVKLQNVNNISLFVRDNQGGEATTAINFLELIGSPRDTTNMADFKRVSGEAGERE